MNLKFKNGKFTLLQVSDPQDLQFVRPTMVRMLNIAYDRVKPDLVVLTGDNILGNHLCDARFGSRIVLDTKEKEFGAMKKAIDNVVAPIEKRNIPFAMIYGNHDDRNRHTKDEQADIYRSYKNCVGLDDPASPDCDTYNIPIYSEDGKKICYNLYMLDSAWYDREQDKCFECVKPEAVEWYKKKSAELKAQNGGKPVPSLMFQHIPMRTELEFLEECGENDKGAVPGCDEGKGKFFRLKSGIDGEIYEYPSVVRDDNGQTAALKECGDVKAVIFGHDHPNCFEASLDGIDYIQTSCASFRCYGARNRGVRVFNLYEDGSYSTEFLTYKNLCGDSVFSELCYIWDADGMAKQKVALIGACGAAVLSGAAAIAAFKKKRGRKK